MYHGRMGIGGFVILLIIIGARTFNTLDRRGFFDEAPPPPPISSPLHPDYHANREQELAAQAAQRASELAQLNQKLNAQTRADSDALLHQSNQRAQAQIERDRQARAQDQQFLQEALRASTPKPHTAVVPTVPRIDRSAVTRTPVPNRPNVPGHASIDRPNTTPQSTQPELIETTPVDVGIQPYAYSPKPDDEVLERYRSWQTDGKYERFLGEAYTFGDWQFKPSTEFAFQRANPRTAKWGAGKAGIGLDADLFTLYPRDHGMTCPVYEDTETKQVFRLGRREIRARGDAEVSQLQSNGLVIWRVHTPANEGDRFGSCYYMAIVGEKDAILFTCRYDAEKPEQIAAFDAVVKTLEYAKK
ncbi:MAG: hypothetical protein AB8C95_12345 [Phycisphaeraceae bacterium]